MKHDEVVFLSMIATMGHLTPNEIMSLADFSVPKEKAEYYLQKWYNKGWYTYSETLGDGTLTREGQKRACGVGVLTRDN